MVKEQFFIVILYLTITIIKNKNLKSKGRQYFKLQQL
jgi:hypothetical protein